MVNGQLIDVSIARIQEAIAPNERYHESPKSYLFLTSENRKFRPKVKLMRASLSGQITFLIMLPTSMRDLQTVRIQCIFHSYVCSIIC